MSKKHKFEYDPKYNQLTTRVGQFKIHVYPIGAVIYHPEAWLTVILPRNTSEEIKEKFEKAFGDEIEKISQAELETLVDVISLMMLTMSIWRTMSDPEIIAAALKDKISIRESEKMQTRKAKRKAEAPLINLVKHLGYKLKFEMCWYPSYAECYELQRYYLFFGIKKITIYPRFPIDLHEKFIIKVFDQNSLNDAMKIASFLSDQTDYPCEIIKDW